MTRSGNPSMPRHRAHLPLRHSVAYLVVLFFALPVLVVAMTGSAAADDTVPAVPTGLAFTIADPRITASSGLARDTDNTVFWTVNETGGSGVVYAIDPAGRTRGTLEFDADLVDVEALAYADRTLYVADIGDSSRTRESVQIYAFTNPRPNQDRGANYRVYDLVYPDGAHDAEAIVVDDDGRIHLVTKAGEGAVYRVPAQLSEGSDNLLRRVGVAPAYVTDATMLPSGEPAVRTYVSVEVLDPELYAPVARAALPYQPQGESMTVSLTGDALLVGSKGPNSQVLRVPIPTELAAAPPGTRTPPPSPGPTAAAGAGGDGANRTGTFVALGLALLVSVAAGLVVLLRDRGHDLAARPVSRPRRLRDAVRPGGARETPDEAETPDGDDDERTVIRRGYRRETWDLQIPDDDDPTELRRR